MRSPKSEVRSPKQTRGAKAEDHASADDSVFWTWGGLFGGPVLNDGPGESERPQDLLERVAMFGEAIVRFAGTGPQGSATNRLIDQLVGAGTSLGANCLEARDGVSRKGFRSRVGTSRKESKEVMFFLRMIVAAEPAVAPEARLLWREAHELNRIYGAIWRGTAP
jgi:four helix bundle protein